MIKRGYMPWMLFLPLLHMAMQCRAQLIDSEDVHHTTKNITDAQHTTKNITTTNKDATKNMTSRQLAARKSWKITLDEIRSMTIGPPSHSTTKLFDRWKLFGKEQRQRFDGFATWEKRLQQFREEASEYLSKSQLETLEAPQKPSEDLLRLNVPVVPAPVREGEEVVPHTDISDKSKKIWIVTTAALPWMTGTAVNPLLRAAYLSSGRRRYGGSATIHLPWLERPEDQERVYGRIFTSPENQELFIRNWLRDTAGMQKASEELGIRWYTAWLQRAENSVYSMGDITALIPEDAADICILEEPEHLNWYRAPGESWTIKFKHVVGVVHTNYFVYAQEQPAAFIRAPSMRLLCAWMCRAHCHRLIKLSGTLGVFAPEKELIENVHGVRQAFLDSGENLCRALERSEKHAVYGADSVPTIYFIGKMLWSKGLGSLMELVKYAEESAGLNITMDMYGGGPDKDEAETKSKRMGLNMTFHGPLDHALLADTHKIFVNPSTSEVLCTTVAEALAMGKFVVVPSHPSNDFFAQFPNCLPYANKEEFVGNLYYAMTHSPEPLTDEYSHALSWEAATKRFEAAATISVAEADAMAEALTASKIGIEIPLPPIIENEEQRIKITAALRLTRSRYRQFRSRLAQEIQQSNVLPNNLQKFMVEELDKRLDLDLDEVLASPTLRIKLSPAELDKQLLEFYNSVSQGPSGDVLRVIGGGTDVGKQNLYLKQMALKEKTQSSFSNKNDEDDEEEYNGVGTPGDSLPVERVKRAIQRNLPTTTKTTKEDKALFEYQSSKQKKNTLEMSLIPPNKHTSQRNLGIELRQSQFVVRPSIGRGCFRPKIR